MLWFLQKYSIPMLHFCISVYSHSLCLNVKTYAIYIRIIEHTNTVHYSAWFFPWRQWGGYQYFLILYSIFTCPTCIGEWGSWSDGHYYLVHFLGIKPTLYNNDYLCCILLHGYNIVRREEINRETVNASVVSIELVYFT